MFNKEKVGRELVKEKLGINEDTLSLYEHELGMSSGLTSPGAEEFHNEDIESLEVFHKLRDLGLNYNQINLLASFSESLKDINLDTVNGIKDLFKISPNHRLKQYLNIAKRELNDLRNKTQDLEKKLKEAFEIKKRFAQFEQELEAKQKLIIKLDRELSDALMEKGRLEARLSAYKEDRESSFDLRSGEGRELSQALSRKDLEISELKKKSEELLEKVTQKELTIKFLETKITHIEGELKEQHKEQVSTLQTQVQDLVDKKQKEWDKYYAQLCEMHRLELTTLGQRHKEQISNLKLKILELEKSGPSSNPIVNLFKAVTSRNGDEDIIDSGEIY